MARIMYTQLQKKPISHFPGQLWKSELRNENIVIPYSVANLFCIISLNNVTDLLQSVHAICQCLYKGSFSKMTSFSFENEYLVLV